MPTTTFNPYIDGEVRRSNVSESWAALISGVGTNCDLLNPFRNAAAISSAVAANKWKHMSRSIFMFDTSPLTALATIISAIFSIFGDSKIDQLGITPDTNLYGATPASEVTLVAADYSQCGIVPFCDTPITYAGFSTIGYNDFTLNAAGRAAINKTGNTILCLRNASYDVAGIEPAYISNKQSWMLGDGYLIGGGQMPKLVVTYSVPAPINVGRAHPFPKGGI